MKYFHILSFILCIIITGCNHRTGQESKNSQPVNDAMKQDVIKDNHITLPGKPSMTPEQYAAWWAGISSDQLNRQTSGSQDASSITWDINPLLDKTVKPNVKQTVKLDLYDWHIIYQVDDDTNVENNAIKTMEDAYNIAIEFMKARGFKEDELTVKGGKPQGEIDAQKISSVRFYFEDLHNKKSYSFLHIDCRDSYIKYAVLFPGIPINNKSNAEISYEQAKQLIDDELKRQGFSEYTIEKGKLLSGKPYRHVKTPFYGFFILIKHHQDILTYKSYELWYVNGLTGEVGKSDKFPEIKDSLNHE